MRDRGRAGLRQILIAIDIEAGFGRDTPTS